VRSDGYPRRELACRSLTAPACPVPCADTTAIMATHLALLATTAYLVPHMVPPASATSRAAVAPLMFGIGQAVESMVPQTTGEAKEMFNKAYGRPVNGMQQSFISEMLNAVTLAMVAPSYKPSRVIYLGIENLCTVFLVGMDSDAEREKLYNSLCAGMAMEPATLQEAAKAMTDAASGKTEAELLASEDLTMIKSAGLKYSYPLGAGLLALMPMVDVEPTDESIARWCEAVGLPPARLQKDWAFFKDAQDKMGQVRQMVMEMAAAAKRKEAQKLKDAAEKAAAEAAEAEAAA